MEYTVASPTKVLDKEFGEKLTEQELLDAGANIAALIASGNISQNATPARQVPQVPQFKDNNHEGDK
jgi:hypothetical protein